MTAKTLRIQVYSFLHMPIVKKILTKLPLVRKIAYGRWFQAHPIDQQYGINTAGFVPSEKIDPVLAKKINSYWGSQPSIVRRALSALPDVTNYSFLDLGCGKGRVTIIAAEYPFREITGVELSSDLVLIARSNAAKVARDHPSAAKIQIFKGDATKFRPQGQKIVFFTYHAFDDELMRIFLKGLEADIGTSIEHCFFIYYNPVCGSVFDDSPALARWFADNIAYDPSELRFGPDISDAVVIWQSAYNAIPTKHPRRDRKIINVIVNTRAVVEV